jgi:heme/copper-type cytochrome/quinol oxidase subunit 4
MRHPGGLAGDWARGWWVFAALIALTIVEFGLLLVDMPVGLFRVLLVALNLADAWLILYYFMHIAQLWRGD